MPLAEFRKNNSKYVQRKTPRRRARTQRRTIEVQPTFQPLMRERGRKEEKKGSPCKKQAAGDDEMNGMNAKPSQTIA